MASELEAKIKSLVEQQEAVQAKQAEVSAYADTHLKLLSLYEAKLNADRGQTQEPATAPVSAPMPTSADGGSIIQAVAGKLTNCLDAIKVDPAALAETLAETNPAHAALVKEMDAAVLQWICRHAAGVMCTTSTDALQDLFAQAQSAPEPAAAPAPPAPVEHAAQAKAAQTPTDKPNGLPGGANSVGQNFGPAKSPATAVRSKPI